MDISDPVLLATIILVLLCALAVLLIAYVGVQQKLEEREAQIRRLTEIGQGLYFYVKDDLNTGRTALSFTGNVSSIRSFEVWRNDRLDRLARPLLRTWEERHTFEGSDMRINLPESRPFTPDGLNEIGKASMEYQPKVPEAWREIDPEKEGDFQ